MAWSGACCPILLKPYPLTYNAHTEVRTLIYLLEQAPSTAEVADLKRLQQAGLAVVPTLVLAGVEAEFYGHNNLAEQIERLFAGVFGARLDEAKLEAACAAAERVLRESYLLPERSDAIRRALPESRLLVRYAGEAPFTVEQGSQAALWAIKRLWASRWQLDAVLERQPELAPPEVPSLIQVIGAEVEADAAMLKRVQQIMDSVEQVWAVGGRVVRVA